MSTTISPVKDLVIPMDAFPRVRGAASINDAVGELFTYLDKSGRLRYFEVLVTNELDQYVGRLTIVGILGCYFPSLFGGRHKELLGGPREKLAQGVRDNLTDLAILLEDTFQEGCRRQGGQPVNQFMLPPVHPIKGDMHPLHAAEIMLDEHVTYLPVQVDQSLVGIVRLLDVFRVLASSCSL